MIKVGQKIPPAPILPELETRKLRAMLILEECLETIEALGFDVFVEFKGYLDPKLNSIVLYNSKEPDLEKIVDGCLDIAVVTTGTLSACGVPDETLQKEVNENNLAKFGPGGYLREDGKWVKPPDHKPPRIKELLALFIRQDGINNE